VTRPLDGDRALDLAAGRLLIADGERGRDAALPTSAVEVARRGRELLHDAVAATDDDLAAHYLEAGELTDDELTAGLAAAFASGGLVPAFAVAPLTSVGARTLLDAIAAWFPPASARPGADGTVVARVFR
ncbi:hypothetical protein, partial [Bradyrhizobium sp. NBAIM08]|uniref:hypothetical protein n=1 Tax=Bradyrhizobium sp. NBAIM08 TaxID=2793815 RepID=UPI001CD1D6E6